MQVRLLSSPPLKGIIMLGDIILIVWLHFIGDFVFQTSWMANNKSDNLLALGSHSILYMLPLFFISWQFAILNGVLHFGVDYGTSKLTSYFWEEEKTRLFFGTIGADQAIHFTILFLSYALLKGVI